MSHFYVSGVRAKIGGYPVLQICREPDELWPKGNVEAYVSYSDRKPGEHAESYRVANAMVRGLNEFYEAPRFNEPERTPQNDAEMAENVVGPAGLEPATRPL